MTIFGWDLSHHDWGRGPVDVAAAVRDGISFATHKVGESKTVTDDRYDDFYQRARAAQVPLIGGYYVNHPGDQTYQADRFLSLLDAKAPGWRNGPFVLQVDAEKFDYMDRAPSPAECKAFCDRLVSRTSGTFRPVLYAPSWVYGDSLAGVGYPLWASRYGTNPAVRYRSAYPGDGSSRWAAYSGQVPALLQYGSRTTIGTQSTCDANAYRGTLAQLLALVSKEDTMCTPNDVVGSDSDGTALTMGEITGRMNYLYTQVLEGGKLGRLDDDIAALSAKVDEVHAVLAARDPVALTDAQVQTLADRIGAVLVAASDNTLTEEDKPVVVAAVLDALRQGTG